MKLNLLPTHVSKEGQTKVAWAFMIGIAVLSVAAGVFAVVFSNNKLKEATDRVAAARPKYEQALATSQKADEIMAGSIVVDRNLKLAKAMNEHNAVYPNLYADVLARVPSFFRVSSISAVPNGPGVCTVTMVGVLQTAQQYADVMLAMLRIPNATNVTRTGFVENRNTIPPLNEQDQLGSPVRPGEQNLPSDPRARLEELVARASQQAPGSFLNTNGFGVAGATVKGAMPDWSQVTITVTINRDIQTPDPGATLAQQGGATAPTTAPSTTPAGGPGGPAGPGNQRIVD